MVLADKTESNLSPDSVDLVFSRNAFHHLEDPEKAMKNLKQALRPGGKIVIIDYKRKSGLIGLLGHYSTEDKIEKALASAGFSRIKSLNCLPRQHFLIYSK